MSGSVRGAAAVFFCFLVACDGAGPTDERRGASSVPASVPGITARGIRAGFTAPDGHWHELEVETIETLEGRIAGLRAPVLDGLSLHGVRVLEEGTEIRRIARLDVGPLDGLRRRGGARPLPGELSELIGTLREVLGPHPDPTRSKQRSLHSVPSLN